MRSKFSLILLAGTMLTIPATVIASETQHTASTTAAASSESSRVFSGGSSSGHAAPAQAAPALNAAPAHGAPADAVASATPGHNAPAAQPQGGSHWEYTGPAGPDQWGSLTAEFGQCSNGRMQSPINISDGLTAEATDIKFDYNISALTISNNGHTIQVDYPAGSGIFVNAKRYELLQLHFHTPSEHLVDGKTYPMEMHLVHKDAGGSLAVVGVMMEMGENNVALSEVWSHLPASAGEPTQVAGVAINARDLLPAQGSYHHYKGSLTTPPCSEGVNWFVLAKPVQISAAQIGSFMNIIGENARPAQPVNNRLLVSEK